MRELLKFVDFACIDSQLYWRTPSQDGKILFEVQWRKDHPSPWRFRQVGDLFWKLCETDHLLEAFAHAQVDLEGFERKLQHTVLQQIAFADKIVEDGKRIFGADNVQNAIAENHRFMNQLQEAIARLTETQGREPKSTSNGPKHPLRLVKT